MKIPTWLIFGSFIALLLIAAPTINALFHIIGIQSIKFGSDFFRHPTTQAIGWLMVGWCLAIVIFSGGITGIKKTSGDA
jgi:hypothetical protein